MATFLENFIEKINKNKTIKALNIAGESAFNIFNSYEGFDVATHLNEDGTLAKKTITYNSFDNAFHINIWNNMDFVTQLATIFWFEERDAKQSNRPMIDFKLNDEIKNYRLTDKNEIIVPVFMFDGIEGYSAYGHIYEVACLGAYYKNKLLLTKEYEEEYLKLSDFDKKVLPLNIKKPAVIDKWYTQKIIDFNELTDEEKEDNKELFTQITEKEEDQILLYLLSPMQKHYKKVYENIINIGNTNEYYYGEDCNFSHFKEKMELLYKTFDEFIEEKTKEQDKNQVLLKLLYKYDYLKEESYEKE